MYSQGFDNLSTSGWIQTNLSAPAGGSWFQGVPEIFTAKTGADNSYAGANYLSAAGGSGTLSNWLISPMIGVGGDRTLVHFSARADFADGFFDTINVYFGSGSGLNTSAFTLIGSLTVPTDAWTDFSFSIPDVASGRIAFEYAGLADNANYVGIDDVTVLVPEPASVALVGAALAGLGWARRTRRSKKR